MSETWQMMEVADSLGQATDLEGACRVLASSPAFGRPFHAVSIALVDDHAQLSEMARLNLPGLPQDFWHLRLWVDSALSRVMIKNQPGVIHRGLFHTLHPDIRHEWTAHPFETVWILPIVERGVPYGAVFMFSKDVIVDVEVDERHRDMLTTSVKLLLRSHEWRHGLQPSQPRKHAS